MSFKLQWWLFNIPLGVGVFANIEISVTRLGNLLDFGQLFKAFGNNKFAQISYILRQFL